MKDRIDCFARINKKKCNALTEKACCNCNFYKHKSKIKDNPYYAYSYTDKDKHKCDMKKHKVIDSQVVS